jgi:hypothetical protein
MLGISHACKTILIGEIYQSIGGQTMAAPGTFEATRNQRLLPDLDAKSFLLSGEPWKSVLFLLLTFGVGFALSSALMMLLAVSVFLSLMIVGIPLLALTAVAWTYLAQMERARIALLTGIRIPSPYRQLPEHGVFQKVKTFATDPGVWKDLIYLLVLFPVGILQLFVVLFAVVTPFALVSAPLGVLTGGAVTVQGIEISSPGGAALAAIAGIILMPVAAYAVTICARGHALIARWLLGKRSEDTLEADDTSTDESNPNG